MKSTIKARLMGLLAVPALALGVASVAMPLEAHALGLKDGAASAQGDDQQADLFGPSGIFKTITNVLLFIIGAISVIMLIIGGIRYTTSGGDSSAVTSAKNTILYAIVGIVVAILAYAVVNFVITSFSANQ